MKKCAPMESTCYNTLFYYSEHLTDIHIYLSQILQIQNSETN